MDTFAAGALASLPPSPEVMKRKPRNSNAFIIVPQMQRLILATGITFVVILLGLLYVLSNYAGGIEAGTPEGLRNLTIFFTVFVMLQFWNMFNAKTFGTNDSAFKNIFKSEGFLTVGMAITRSQLRWFRFQDHPVDLERMDLDHACHVSCTLGGRNIPGVQTNEKQKVV